MNGLDSFQRLAFGSALSHVRSGVLSTVLAGLAPSNELPRILTMSSSIELIAPIGADGGDGHPDLPQQVLHESYVVLVGAGYLCFILLPDIT